MLTVSELSSGYQGAKVLREVSFDVAAGEIVCLLGRNGAGKSTCLKTIMGLIRPTGGRVECHHPARRRDRDRGFTGRILSRPAPSFRPRRKPFANLEISGFAP